MGQELHRLLLHWDLLFDDISLTPQKIEENTILLLNIGSHDEVYQICIKSKTNPGKISSPDKVFGYCKISTFRLAR